MLTLRPYGAWVFFYADYYKHGVPTGLPPAYWPPAPGPLYNQFASRRTP